MTPKSTSSNISTWIKNQAYRYTGKLLLRHEIPLNDKTLNYLIKERIFESTPSFKNKILIKQCLRCGNKKDSLLGVIPCLNCQSTHLYCRNCIEMGRVMECERLYRWIGKAPSWLVHDNPCTWEGELTKPQQQASSRIVEAINKEGEELLVWAVCGAGKTEMLFQGITTALKQGKRICLATPRADVVRELKPRFQQAFANVSVQALYGGSQDRDATAQLILATTHQLLRFKKAFDVMIIDEIDAFPYHADPSLPFATSRAKKSTCTTIYLTATPRKNQQSLITRKKLPHIFVPIRYHGYPLPVPQMKMTLSLKKDLQKYQPPATFITWVNKRQNSRRQLLIFVPSISLAEQITNSIRRILLEEKIIEKNNAIDFVHAEDPWREEKVQQFRNKELKIIITTTILERGVTFPSVDVAILDAGHDVFDEAALVQIAGRAGRSADDPTGEVIFFHDGKTEAMIQAISSIKQMNQRGGVGG